MLNQQDPKRALEEQRLLIAQAEAKTNAAVEAALKKAAADALQGQPMSFAGAIERQAFLSQYQLQQAQAAQVAAAAPKQAPGGGELTLL